MRKKPALFRSGLISLMVVAILPLLVIGRGVAFGQSPSAVLVASVLCSSGWRVQLNSSSALAVQTSGWQKPSHLLDEQSSADSDSGYGPWSIWGHNSPGPNIAEIQLGGMAQLTAIQSFSFAPSSGQIEIQTISNGAWQTVSQVALPNSGWATQPVSFSADKLRIVRRQTTENISELIICATPLNPTSTPAPSTSTPTNTPIVPTPTNTPVVQSGATNWLSPSSQSSATGGDHNGLENNPTNAFADDGRFATDINSGSSTSTSCTSTAKDRHIYDHYNIALPTNASITGIEVRVDARVDAINGSPKICVFLSSNAGTTWTASRALTGFSTNESSKVAGSPSDLWGKNWDANALNNSQFRVRLAMVSADPNRDFSIDWVAIKVHYTTPVATVTPATATATTVTPTATPTPTTVAPTPTAGPSATPTTTPTPVPTLIPATATSTPTVQPSATPTPIPTLIPATATSAPTATPTPIVNRAAVVSSYYCPSGLKVDLSKAAVVAVLTSGWQQPLQLIDEQSKFDQNAGFPWTIWGHNSPGPNTAEIIFDGVATLNQLFVYAYGPNAGGTFTVEVPNGQAGWQQSASYLLPPAGPIGYQFSATTDRLRITRLDSTTNISELLLCVGSDGGVVTPTVQATAADSSSTSTVMPTPTLTSTPTLTPTPMGPTPTPGPLEMMPKSDEPFPLIRSSEFGGWPTNELSAECIRLHNRYWVLAPDNRAYHTWHPAAGYVPETGEYCEFGHEHGMDPSKSPLFQESGGWPPFAYVNNIHADAGGHRHEDHMGHKVNVAHYRASFGNSANSNDILYDAGFECDFLSKQHQGSWSADAFSNHMHEYFLTVRCNDQPNTAFSIKRMITFGPPNEFKDMCNYSNIYSSANVVGFDGFIIPQAAETSPIGNNWREFTCFNQIMWKSMEQVSQADLWTEVSTINTPTGVLEFGPYYIVKNPSRLFDPVQNRIVRTIDQCYDASGNKLAYPYCAPAPTVKPDWNSVASPFDGTLRAVNFKAFGIYNEGGAEYFCTDVFGRFPHLPPCGVGELLQRVAPINNHWKDNTRCRYDVNGVCHLSGISGSLMNAIPIPNDPNGGYYPSGIGGEFIIDMRNEPGVRAQN